jgi:hypothetical protein
MNKFSKTEDTGKKHEATASGAAPATSITILDSINPKTHGQELQARTGRKPDQDSRRLDLERRGADRRGSNRRSYTGNPREGDGISQPGTRPGRLQKRDRRPWRYSPFQAGGDVHALDVVNKRAWQMEHAAGEPETSSTVTDAWHPRGENARPRPGRKQTNDLRQARNGHTLDR